METEWVKLCPMLQIEPPHPLAGDFDSRTKEVMEIYDFFKEVEPLNPVGAFLEHFNRLPVSPSIHETKIGQVTKSVRLLKLARKTQAELAQMGIQ